MGRLGVEWRPLTVPITQLIIAAVIAIVLFIGGFLLGEWLHGLGDTLLDALAAAWDRLFTGAGDGWNPFGNGGAGGTVAASDGTRVPTDGDCHNGWAAFPGDSTASRCIMIDSPERAA